MTIHPNLGISDDSPIARAVMADHELGVRVGWALAVENSRYANEKILSRIWKHRLEAARPKQGRLL